MKKEEVRGLLSLDSSIDVIKIEVKKEKGKTIKYVEVKSINVIIKTDKNVNVKK